VYYNQRKCTRVKTFNTFKQNITNFQHIRATTFPIPINAFFTIWEKCQTVKSNLHIINKQQQCNFTDVSETATLCTVRTVLVCKPGDNLVNNNLVIIYKLHNKIQCTNKMLVIGRWVKKTASVKYETLQSEWLPVDDRWCWLRRKMALCVEDRTNIHPDWLSDWWTMHESDESNVVPTTTQQLSNNIDK